MTLRARQVRAAELERALSFAEQYVLLNFGVRPTFEEEMKEAYARIPTGLWAEIKEGVRLLLTPPPRKKGRFVVLTGLNGAGKETHLENPRRLMGVRPVAQLLREWGYRPLAIKAPMSGTRLGSVISLLLGDPVKGIGLRGKLSPDRLWLLWSLIRALHRKKVEAWLDGREGRVVVAKRWTESNIMYHQLLGVEARRILDFERNLLEPDITIVLDAPADVCLRRNVRMRVPPFINAASLPTIREGYLRLEQSYRAAQVLTIDTNREARIASRELADRLASVFSPLRR